jgi:hypothetical protein
LPTETRVRRGGGFSDAELAVRSTSRGELPPNVSGNTIGFRVASVVVPEPGTALLLAASGLTLLLRRRR